MKKPEEFSLNFTSLVSSDHERELLRLIAQRLGITLAPKAKDLQTVMALACQKFQCSVDDYLAMLRDAPDHSPLLEHLISEITVGETYFFRDKRQMQFLRFELLPKIIQQKRETGQRSLRIWSAGCASGEEIYTMAMMLHELLPDRNRWTLNLLGTDINMQALQKAQKAVYNRWSMRAISAEHKQQFLTLRGQQYWLAPSIRDQVNFLYLNLNEDHYPSILNGTNSQDLILCRNVLIYFNQDSVLRVMKKLSQSLGPNGYLMLGASDPLQLEGCALSIQAGDGLVLSHKEEKGPDKSVLKPLLKTQRAPLSLKPLKPLPPPISTGPSAEDLCEEAKRHANLGQLNLALQYCEQSLQLEPTLKEAHFIAALVLMEQNRYSEAEAALRKTLFLDRKFVEGHFQLGLLLLKNKSHKEGLKSLKNALKIASLYPPSEEVPNAQGLNYGRFVEILNAEMALHGLTGSLSDEA